MKESFYHSAWYVIRPWYMSALGVFLFLFFVVAVLFFF